MTDRFSPREGRLDDHVVGALRDLLAPPGGEGYWTELEGSIMARIDAGDLGWWSELTSFARPAMVAAAALILAASVALMRTSRAEAHAVYEDVVAITHLPENTLRPAVDQGDLEESLRTLFTP